MHEVLWPNTYIECIRSDVTFRVHINMPALQAFAVKAGNFSKKRPCAEACFYLNRVSIDDNRASHVRDLRIIRETRVTRYGATESHITFCTRTVQEIYADA